MKKLCIIGNSIACDALLEELGEDHGFNISVFSAETVPFYNRIMLSPILGKEMSLADASPRPKNWYTQRSIKIHINKTIIHIDTKNQQIQCEDGSLFHFDYLVIATGSKSFIPAISGADYSNVIGFRDLNDVDMMQDYCAKKKPLRSVVIGGGLLGVEAACGLKLLGAESYLMHRRPILMNRQLDQQGSQLLIDALEEREIELLLACNPIAINGDGHQANRLVYEKRQQQFELEVDLIVFATGIKPVTELAQNAGIQCKKGIVVNAQMQTSIKGIYALGECVEFNGATYGLVAPIKQQAKVLAETLKDNTAKFAEQDFVTCLKVSGLAIHSMGEIDNESAESIEVLDKKAGIYKRLLIKDEHLIGALLIGDIEHSQLYFQLLTKQQPITEQRYSLIFDPKIMDNTTHTIAKVA